MSYNTLSEIQSDLGKGALTLPELVQAYLGRINEEQSLNAFLEVYEDEAMERAQEIQSKMEQGTAGRLAGLVIGIKDNICFKGHKVSAASHILEGFESLFSSTVVDRLLAEDVVIIGRLNCDEFAMGSANENSYYGPVLNPKDRTKVPGGSSGGSAAAVAAGMCHAALGSDTGGSIRQPASFTGIVGYKPTYGTVSRHGLIAYASSFDQIGPMTKSVEDASLLLDIMAGPDEYDSTASQEREKSYEVRPAEKAEKKKIGYIAECIESEGLDPEVRQRMIDEIEWLRSEGHTVEEVHFPYLGYMVPTYYILTTAEASSNLARYDGVHFGYRSETAEGLEPTYKQSRTEGFGEEVKRRIMLGTFVLSSGYYDAYYGKAQKVRRLIQEKTSELLSAYDFLLSPTTPHSAFELGKKYDDPTVMYLEDIFTVQSNLAGNPAISLPLGETNAGLPFGIQYMGKRKGDVELLQFSADVMNKRR